MMLDNVAEIITSITYFYPARYISGRIVEYDMKAANITMLRKSNLITQEEYNYLGSLPKYDREVSVGKLCRKDPKYYKAISDGIKHYKLQLADKNNIKPEEIIRVANDAVYINRYYNLKNITFGDVEFRIKSISDVIVKLRRDIIIFCSFTDTSYSDIDIEVKGIKPELVSLHNEYMLTIIGTTIAYFERGQKDESLKYLNEAIEHYIKRELDIGYYRNFNSLSNYRLKNSTFEISNPPQNINDVDINYNLGILRDLWSIIFETQK